MKPAPPITDDDARVASLRRMNLLSTPRERDFDRVTRLAQALFDTNIALISLVDSDRQWFKSRVGLDATETARDISFCGHTIEFDEAFVVHDTLTDERFRDNPLVTGGPYIRFYAGQPLTNIDGFRVGTLCVISDKPREFGDIDQKNLADIAKLAEVLFRHRELNESHLELLASLEAANRDKMIDPLTGIWNRRGLDELMPREIALARRENYCVGVAMLDIDCFKAINDTYGHDVGDIAVQLVAGLLVAKSRQTDLVTRFAGDEFVLIMPKLSHNNAPAVMEKLLNTIRNSAVLVTGQGSHNISVSIGVCVYDPDKADDIDARELLKIADKALFVAKENGRNCFEVAL